jgi:hypothetical protein
MTRWQCAIAASVPVILAGLPLSAQAQVWVGPVRQPVVVPVAPVWPAAPPGQVWISPGWQPAPTWTVSPGWGARRYYYRPYRRSASWGVRGPRGRTFVSGYRRW